MTEETRIVEKGTAADVAAVVEAAEAETTTASTVEAVMETAVEAVAEVQEEAETVAESVMADVSANVAEVVAESAPVTEAVVEAVAEVQEETEAVAESVVADVSANVAEVVAESAPVAEAGVEAVAEVQEETEVVAQSASVKVAEVGADMSDAVTEKVEAVSEFVAGAVEAVSAKVDEAVASVTESISEAVAGVTGSDESTNTESSDEEDRRVVRLSVGQEVQGVIKRITDFGAFVDIGAGRDGLIHISEMAVGRVNQVADVVQAGQAMTLWIKKLDRARNRISLTLISPDTKTIKDINDGDVVPGTVSRIVPYGAFIDIGVGTDALLHVREMSNSYVAKPEDVVKLGEQLDVRILAVNRRRRRIDLSLKGLRDEPEPEVAEMAEAAAALGVQGDGEVVDPYENVEVLSPMELAFKRAMEAEGVEVDTAATSKRKGGRSKKNRSMQDEIIRRTLETMRE